ncbi:MAG: D-glycero-beta-D-manno-heptose-7-phosphate kinase [candidate division Zixibacteria bacterium]|nr:D-glycero-beta-D-manno-heptose-7-phosphate kinase [candidate division Zixibacteria bacterium]
MSIKPDRIEKIITNIGKAKILILGDIMLDEYLYGDVGRISPEAPVPVVDIKEEQIKLGGAANVANNIATLGDEPILLGTVGEDDASVKLSQLLKHCHITRDFLVNDPERRTTIKTRIIAQSQQIVRADREDTNEISEKIEKLIVTRFMSIVDKIDAIIISDYGKGIITASLLENIIPVCKENKVFVAVDPKESNFFNYKGVSVVTPNHHEAGFVAGRRIVNENDLKIVSRILLDKLQAESLLITRGGEGMALFTADDKVDYFPTVARKVFDVTGAGDTVISAFVSAITAGATLKEAALISNCAAGAVVAEIGTAAITSKKLAQEFKDNFTE